MYPDINLDHLASLVVKKLKSRKSGERLSVSDLENGDQIAMAVAKSANRGSQGFDMSDQRWHGAGKGDTGIQGPTGATGADGIPGPTGPTGGGGNPGGSDTQVQFNDSNSFGGSSDFTFDKSPGGGARMKASDGTTGLAGGSVEINGGQGGGSTTFRTGATILAEGGQFFGNGGDAIIEGGTSENGTQGGGVVINGGDATDGDGAGGTVEIKGGHGNGINYGGFISIQGGQAATGGVGGDVRIVSGLATATGPLGNIALGAGTTGPSRISDFIYIPTAEGSATGMPSSLVVYPNLRPLVFDTTNNKLYIYNSGWKSVTLT